MPQSKTATRRKAARPAARKLTAQQKFAIMRDDMKSIMVERDEEIDVVLTALIAGEHPLLVGPPGTGKSMLLDLLLSWMGEDVVKFQCLFNAHTMPEEIFGPVSVTGLKQDVYRRITTNKLPEAHVAFADEIFKAQSSILNTMLRILNERQYDNGDGQLSQCPLRICVAASNEWPSDTDGGRELGALFDRFLFRKVVRPISRSARETLLWEQPEYAKLSTKITPDEIDDAIAEAYDLEFTQAAKTTLVDILDELNKQGIFPGDRRMFKSIKAAKAYAYLCGADEVDPEHLEILAHVLWDDPAEQPEECAKIVVRLANPEVAKVNGLLQQASDVLTKCTPTEAVPKLQAIQKELSQMGSDRGQQATEYIGKEIKRLYDAVIGA